MSNTLTLWTPELYKTAAEDRWTRIVKLLDDAEPRLRDAFMRAAKNAKAMEQKDLIRYLEAGNIDAAVELFSAHSKKFAAEVNKIVADSGHATADFLNKRQLVVAFDQVNGRAVRMMQNNSLRVVREITDEQRAVLRQVMERGITEGVNPVEQARRFRESIGLTAKQEAAVANYARLLREGSTEALTRKLRDRRFDAKVRSTTPLQEEQISRMVERYRERYIKYRAEVIGRTEALRSVHQGADEMYRQAVDTGHLKRDSIEREWHVRLDGRERESHHAMSGQIRALDEPFLTGAGYLIKYPGDPDAPASETIQCRCAVTTRLKDLPIPVAKPIVAAPKLPKLPKKIKKPLPLVVPKPAEILSAVDDIPVFETTATEVGSHGSMRIKGKWGENTWVADLDEDGNIVHYYAKAPGAKIGFVLELSAAEKQKLLEEIMSAKMKAVIPPPPVAAVVDEAVTVHPMGANPNQQVAVGTHEGKKFVAIMDDQKFDVITYNNQQVFPGDPLYEKLKQKLMAAGLKPTLGETTITTTSGTPSGGKQIWGKHNGKSWGATVDTQGNVTAVYAEGQAGWADMVGSDLQLVAEKLLEQGYKVSASSLAEGAKAEIERKLREATVNGVLDIADSPHTADLHRKLFTDWTEKADLSGRQLSALNDYQGAEYDRINSHLRTGKSATQMVKTYIDELDKVFEKAPPLEQDTNAYRIAFHGENSATRRGLRIGSVYEDKGFLSTSMDKEVWKHAADSLVEARALANDWKGVIYKYRIRAKQGSKVVILRPYGKEFEMLLNRGTKFRVTAMTPDAPHTLEGGYHSKGRTFDTVIVDLEATE